MPRWQLKSDQLAPSIQATVQKKQWHWLIIVLWMVPLLLVGFFNLDQQSLMAHDEGLYARRARVILDMGDWIHPWATPHHKTPGPYWLLATSMTMLGKHEVAVRLPSVLASFICGLLTYGIGRRLMSPTAALLGSLSLAVAPLWLQYSRLATPDIVFTSLVLLAVWLLLKTQDSAPFSRPWLRFFAGMSLGLSVLVRSALAALPIFCLLPYFCLSGRRHLKSLFFYAGICVGLLPTAGWLWLCWQRYGMAILHSLGNFPVTQGLSTTRAKSGLFYIFNLLLNDFLWSLFAFGALMLLMLPLIKEQLQGRFKGRAKGQVSSLKTIQTPQISLLMAYPVLYIGCLSLASTKLPHYALPAYPWLALLTGYAMDQLLQTRWQADYRRWINKISHVFNGGLLLIGSILTVAALLAFSGVLPSTIRPYAPIALGLGLAWVGASLIWFRRHTWLPWLTLLLLGHWLSLTLAWGTIGLGNVNPELKALLIAPNLQPILQTETIGFSPGMDSKLKTLLRFYTPHPGAALNSLEQLAAEQELDIRQPGYSPFIHDYLWIEEHELGTLPHAYQVLGNVKNTYLIRLQTDEK